MPVRTLFPTLLYEADLAELPPEVADHMTFVPVRTLEEVLAIALPSDPLVS